MKVWLGHGHPSRESSCICRDVPPACVQARQVAGNWATFLSARTSRLETLPFSEQATGLCDAFPELREHAAATVLPREVKVYLHNRVRSGRDCYRKASSMAAHILPGTPVSFC
jgi:hypothetical protein